MRRLIAGVTIAFIFALCGSWILRGQELVEVKEIPAEGIRELKQAESEVENASKALAAAQKALLEANERKTKIVSKLASNLAAFEGECAVNYPKLQGGTTYAIGYIPSRSFRRVTINGKFMMVHAGTESCSSLTYQNNALGWEK